MSYKSLHWAHPLVQEWFIRKFGSPTEPQEQGWPHILAGETTLISAPTGSGKTLAAFLACLDGLVRQALDGELQHRTEVLYVSPLKALSNDVQKNLLAPLHEISQLAHSKNLSMAEIHVAVRTGDTLPRERQAMLKKPPHILVTTPESLYILLTAEKSRAILQDIKTIIVDEIHALANNKRGAHLALTLERLTALTSSPPVRIGLSATQKPLTTVANFLVGNERPGPAIINIGHVRHLDLAIEIPASELSAVASNEMWDEIYDRLAELTKDHRSVLVFVNTRRLAERVAHHLRERLGEDQVAAHHGSLSRKLRLAAETKLKHGELKLLVATASLELGIDIGTIDLVCQIGSPRAIAVALQRIGRAGHWRGAISKGRIFATTRDELLECAALIYAIRQGDLDQLIIPRKPLDILAQQIVAICATGDWHEDDLFKLVRRAFHYADLTREEFDDVLKMFAEGIAGSRGRYGAYLFRDQVNHLVKARRGSRWTAIMNGGAIPDNGLFTVIAEPAGTMVGTLDEDFAIESNRGDIILLGNTSWQIRRIESATGRVLVEDAHGAPPSVPFWLGEAPSRTFELSLHLSLLRQKISDLLTVTQPAIVDIQQHPDTTKTVNWIITNCGVDQAAAEQIIEYILQGRAILGAVPSQKTIIAERFFDEGGGMQLIIHSPFGARINKAWGLALRKRFCRSFNFELQAAATDNGLNIALAEQHSFPLADVFQFLHPNSLKDVLTQAVLQSALFTTRWRWTATRSLALVRFRNGKKIPPNIQRMLADDLLAAVFPDAAACQDNLAGQDVILPEHPLVAETMKDALTEALDTEGLIKLITEITNGNIACLAIDTPMPSPFCHEILNANPYAFLDDAPLEERRARAVEMRRTLPASVLQDVGRLDPLAISEVQTQAWPDIRNADELHDFLQTVIALPMEANWQDFLDELINNNRAGIANYDDKKFWFAVEKAKTLTIIYPEIQIPKNLPEINNLTIPDRDTAILEMIRGWMQHLGPITPLELSKQLHLTLSEIEQSFLHLESTGLILRGNFRNYDAIEWCERRLLARIHRLTIGRLRQEIAPIPAAQFIHWLLKWQHLLPSNKLQGEQGLLAIIKQLQGYEIAANAWEREIFPRRLEDYDKSMLDRLCLSGAIGWGRLSTHPAIVEPDEPNNSKRISPTSIVPITFFIREETDWLLNSEQISTSENRSNLSHIAKDIYSYLHQRGASFVTDIVRGTQHLKAEIDTGLWELVTAGLVTADAFDNLRALIDPRRRLPKKRRRSIPILYNSGRWSLLQLENNLEPNKKLEACCWMLLHRYGVVFRDLLVREKNIPRWRELLITFRRLEDRGEIRGGRFVSGFLGEQFALPYAVESLRHFKKQISTEELTITLSAVDPLNLMGIIIPGIKIPAVSGKKVTYNNLITIT